MYIYIYKQTLVSSFTGLISVARVNEYRTTDLSTVFKTPGAELIYTFIYMYNIYTYIIYIIYIYIYIYINHQKLTTIYKMSNHLYI